MKKASNIMIHGVSSSHSIEEKSDEKLYFSTVLSTMNSFFFGLHTTSLEILKPLYYSSMAQFAITEKMWSVLSSIIFIGALLGNTLSLYLKLNLKIYLIVTIISYCVGHVMIAFAESYLILIFGRVVIGIASGFTCAIVPMYLSFLAPSNIRGFIGCAHQMMIVSGIFVGQILSFLFQSPNLVGIVYKLILISYLIILILMTRIKNIRNVISGRNKTISELINNPLAHNSLLLSILLHSGQQFTGINAIYLFSNNILKNSISNEKIGSLSLGLTSIFFTLLNMGVIEKFGRKLLLIASLIGISMSLLFLSLNMKPLISLYGFIGSFSIGMGPVTWLIINEMFPDEYKSSGNIIAVSTNWISAFIVTFTFSFLFYLIGQMVFMLYTGLMLALCVILVVRLSETKGRKNDFQ